MIKDWPVYFKDRLIIDNPGSNVGVATLWMPKDNVAAALAPGSFSVCGQLYTKRGLNPMFRNMLANPNIRYIVLCGVDRQGSGDALVKFFENGIEEETGKGGELNGWRIIGDDEALIDKEISLEALELLRASVELRDLRMNPLDKVAQEVSGLKPLKPFGEPQLFNEAEPLAVDQFPSDKSVFKVKRDYVGEAWLDVLKTINKFGSTIPGMYGDVKELHNMCVIVEKEDTDEPKIPEYLNFKKEGLGKYLTGFFEVDKGSEAYTYGERIFDWDGIDQEKIMVEKLTRFPYDRGALAVLWKPHKDNFPPEKTEVTKEGQTKGWRVPCLVMLLGQCLEEDFHLTAVFRNNDMFGAWPLNAFALRSFQKNIAKKIGKNLGVLTTVSHVAEIYEIDWESSTKIVTENDSLARTCMWDPRGYYTIEVQEQNIVVTFMSPDGSVELAKYIEDGNKPKIGRDICAMALKDMLISDLGSAMDFGRQVSKAENAVKLGLKFEQDNLLTFSKKDND